MDNLYTSANASLSDLLPVSTLDAVIPSFEALFNMGGAISIWDSEGRLYYGLAGDQPPLRTAAIEVSGHDVGFVGHAMPVVLPQIDEALLHLAITLSCVAQETLRRRQLGLELLERYDELNLIYDLGLLIADQGMTADEIVRVFLAEARRILDADAGVIYLYAPASDHRRSELVPVSFFGDDRDTHFWMGRMRELALSTLHAYDEARLSDGEQVVCAPLRHHDQRLGALVLLYERSDRVFRANDVHLLMTLTQNVALFLQAARLYQRLEMRNQELERTLAELKEARDELSRAERLSIIGQTISGLVHDMRKPLSNVMGYAGLLQDEILTDDERSLYASQIIRYVNTFSAMAQEILDYTQSDARINQRVLPLDDYLERIRHQLLPPGLELPVQIIVDYNHARGHTIHVDPDRFARVFQNLVNNAIDAIEEHGGTRVEVIAEADDTARMIRFMVRDDGPGVNPEIAHRIFEPFVTGKSTGTGLGLAIVAHMIEMHGGTIHYETSPAGGACFVFTLPQG